MSSVIIPWLGGDEYREAALAWVLPRYRALPSVERSVNVAVTGEPWCKAEAVMPAIRRSRADVVVVADADVWTDGLQTAIYAVACGVAEWAVPHRRLYRLDCKSTERVLNGEDELDTRLSLEEHHYDGRLGGGIVVAHRDTLLDVPLDPRYKGWGQEDESWGMALRSLYGDPYRGDAPLFHFWHPRAERWTRRRGSQKSWNLYKRYNDARFAGPAAMRRLLEEAA